jgi:hypothetical protein
VGRAEQAGTLGASEQKRKELGRIMGQWALEEEGLKARSQRLIGAVVASSRCMITLVIVSVNKIRR